MPSLEGKLPIETCGLINAHIPPLHAQGNNTFKWKHIENGYFSMTSAYDVIAGKRNSNHHIFER